MDQEVPQKERPPITGGRKISRLRPPQISASSKNKFGFIKETAVAEKADFEQLEKPESFKDIPCKTDKDLWKEMVGEPVCVGGVKNGILRYFGPTKFADGIWCGVELNDPIGKNDGTIDGVSYFSCKKQHGIFAPLSKVHPIAPSDSLLATKLSNNVQQNNETESVHKDTTQTIHKSYIGVSEKKIRTNSSKEPPKNLTFSATCHNSTFNTGLRKPRDICASSLCDEHFKTGSKHDVTYNMNKSNVNVVTSNKSANIDDYSLSHPKRYIEQKKQLCYTTGKNDSFSGTTSKDYLIMNTTVNIEKADFSTTFTTEDDIPHDPNRHIEQKKQLCYTTGRNDQFSGTTSKDYLTMNATVNIEKADFNSTFTMEDDIPHEHEPVQSSDILNVTFGLDSSEQNKSITQLLPKKLNDQTIDLNATFTFNELSKVECLNETESDHYSQENIRKLSLDDVFNPDIDDDQQSLDLDESLGILTPNQMKDFTVCIDQQSVIMLDGNISRIPKISSCDNIDDIPEDEVKDTFSQLSSDNNFYTRVLRDEDFEHALNSPSFSQTQLTEGKTFVRLVHQFDNTEGKEFSLNSRQTSTPYSSSREKQDLSPVPYNSIVDITSNVDKGAKMLNFFLENKQSDNLGLCSSEAFVSMEHNTDGIQKSYDKSINSCSHLEQEELPDCSLLTNVSASDQINSNILNVTKVVKQFTSENITNNVTFTTCEEKRIDESIILLKETSKNRSDSIDQSYIIADSTKIITPDIVSANSDKQMCFETECFESDVECLKTERPASTYTVGSTDTGYQEDGDFDVRSELSIATQSPCSELPAHSMYSSIRSMGIEDSERHPVIEIMSDSDFFTDSGGIGFTESEMETDGECKVSSDFLQDSDKMCTVIEQNMSENEDVSSTLASEMDNTSEDHSAAPNFKVTEETVITQPSSTTFTAEITENSTAGENNVNKITADYKNDESEKKSKVEKINSFIIADKEGEGNYSLLEKNNSSEKKGLANNKAMFKTQQEVPRNKRDNILKTKTLNDNIIVEKKPRKNVVSKIKLMIENSPSNLMNKNDENNPKSSRLPRKSRWEDVTSKIAASMAVDKTKSKEKKEIKSRIDTNLLGAKPTPSRRTSRIDSTRSSFSVKNENASNVDVSSAKGPRNLSQRAKNQPPQLITNVEKSGNQENSNNNRKNKLKPSKSISSTLSNASYSSSTSKQSSGISQNTASRNTAGMKSNTSKQDISAARKSSLRLSTTQTYGRTSKRDENTETSGHKPEFDGVQQLRKQQRNRKGIPRLIL